MAIFSCLFVVVFTRHYFGYFRLPLTEVHGGLGARPTNKQVASMIIEALLAKMKNSVTCLIK